jgi:hypothetical protein
LATATSEKKSFFCVSACVQQEATIKNHIDDKNRQIFSQATCCFDEKNKTKQQNMYINYHSCFISILSYL